MQMEVKSVQSAPVGFIGLGSLGQPVARNLISAGYALTVYNRDPRKVDAFVELGARRAHVPADAVIPGGVVVSLLWDDASVEAVVRSENFLSRLGQGGIHVSMTTLSPGASAELAAVHAGYGSTMVEAPIFGRPEAAAAGRLWFVTAGPQSSKQYVRPLLEAAGAQGVFDFGEKPGAALAVKLIGNMLIVSAAASLTEGLSLARSIGIDPQTVVDMLTTTLFPAPIYKSYGQTIAQNHQAFDGSAIPAKDIGLLAGALRNAELPLALSQTLLEVLERR